MVSEKLAFFTPITELFSGNNYPTANLFFSRGCDLKLKLIEWMDDSNVVVSNMAKSMDLKFQKYWNDIHDLLSVVVVLDPRCKLEFIEFFVVKFGSDEPDMHFGAVRHLMCEQVHEYQNTSRIVINNSTIATPTTGHNVGSSSASSDFERFVSERKKSKMIVVQYELDHYLADDVAKDNMEIDLLGW